MRNVKGSVEKARINQRETLMYIPCLEAEVAEEAGETLTQKLTWLGLGLGLGLELLSFRVLLACMNSSICMYVCYVCVLCMYVFMLCV